MSWKDAPEGVADPVAAEEAGPFIGDVVSLITGSPAMAVIDLCYECGDVEVVWYDDHGGLQFATLPAEVLR